MSHHKSKQFNISGGSSQSSDNISLLLEFNPNFETVNQVHQWKRMMEMDAFVGARRSENQNL